MKQQEQHPANRSGRDEDADRQLGSQPGAQPGTQPGAPPDTQQRASHVSSTDAQYGTRSSMGDRASANAGPARTGGDKPGPGTEQGSRSPTRGGAQTGLTGSIGQLESDAQNIQRPGGANPSAQSNRDWQHQSDDAVPSAAAEQDRAAQAGAGRRMSQTQGGDVAVDRSTEGAHAQARSSAGSAAESTLYPDQGPGESGGKSKYSPTANEQDRISRESGGESLREDGDEALEDSARRRNQQQ